MSGKQVAEFISKATDFSVCNENGDRVKNFLRDYDANDDGFVEEEQFLQFYLNASINKKTTVFDNLRSLGYGKDLRLKVDESKVGNVEFRESIRYKLVTQEDSYTHQVLANFDKMTRKCSEIIEIIKNKTLKGENSDEERNELKLIIRWSTQLKKFIYTMPPSVKVVEDILFRGAKNFEKLKEQGQVGYYKLVVLFSILFKSDKIRELLQVVSEGKCEPLPTSNENLKMGKSASNPRPETPGVQQEGPLGHEHGVHPQTRVQNHRPVAFRGDVAPGNFVRTHGHDN